MSQAHTDAMLERHRKQRERDLVEVAKAGIGGLAPYAGLPTQRLLALKSRGLVEVRYCLTRDGADHLGRIP